MIYLILNLVTPPRHILSLSRGYAPAPMSRPPLPARARARGSPRRACPRPSERLSPTAPAHFQISNSLSVHASVHAIHDTTKLQSRGGSAGSYARGYYPPSALRALKPELRTGV